MTDLNDIIDGLRKRVYDLERNQQRGSDTFVVTGTALGVVPPASGALTNPVSPTTPAKLVEARIELDAPASSDVTFDFLRSGTSVGSCTCPSGSAQSVQSFDEGFTPADPFRVQATAPGGGYTTFTVHTLWQTTRDWWHPAVQMFAAAASFEFEMDVSHSDESGDFARQNFDVDIPSGTRTVTATFTEITTPSRTFSSIHWVNDPDGTATPSASATPGTVGPVDATSTDSWPVGTMTLELKAVVPGGFGDTIGIDFTIT